VQPDDQRDIALALGMRFYVRLGRPNESFKFSVGRHRNARIRRHRVCRFAILEIEQSVAGSVIDG
jgi:hypothetical protein